jgi:hypothetical protein
MEVHRYDVSSEDFARRQFSKVNRESIQIVILILAIIIAILNFLSK